MVRVWHNPRLGVATTIVLMVDLLVFSLMAPVHFGWLCTPFVLAMGLGGGSFRPAAPTMQIWQRGEEILLTDLNKPPESTPGETLVDRDILFAWIRPRSTGLVSPILTYDNVRLSLPEGTHTLNPTELETVKRLYADHLVAWRGGMYAGTEFPELVIRGGGEYRRWSVLAIIHDALFVLAVPLAVSGLRQGRQDHRRERMLAKADSGICP